MWRAYISFLESCPSLDLDRLRSGTAVHHILWESEYPKFHKSRWNRIRLYHDDHAAAAALALAAEPWNAVLRDGFDTTYRICGNGQRWRPKRPKEVIQLYAKQGYSLNDLAKRFKVSVPCIHNFLIRSGISRRNNSEAAKIRWTKHGHSCVGRILSIETRRKIGKANKGNQYCLGRVLSSETKRKIGRANKGNKYRLGMKATK